jgi:hypothetical protein
MRSEVEYSLIKKWEGPAAEQAARKADLAESLGQPVNPLPDPVSANMDGLIELMRLVNDPAGFKKRVTELMATTTACNEARTKAENAIASSHEILADHAAKLKADKADHDAKCADAWAAIHSMQAASKDEAEKLRADREEVERIKADLGARVAAIKSAGWD